MAETVVTQGFPDYFVGGLLLDVNLWPRKCRVSG